MTILHINAFSYVASSSVGMFSTTDKDSHVSVTNNNNTITSTGTMTGVIAGIRGITTAGASGTHEWIATIDSIPGGSGSRIGVGIATNDENLSPATILPKNYSYVLDFNNSSARVIHNSSTSTVTLSSISNGMKLKVSLDSTNGSVTFYEFVGGSWSSLYTYSSISPSSGWKPFTYFYNASSLSLTGDGSAF